MLPSLSCHSCARRHREELRTRGLFHDYTVWVVLTIVLGGTSGLMISVIFKYIDNIALLVADIIGMLALIVISYEFFDLQINAVFVLGVAVIMLALVGYYGRQFGQQVAPATTIFVGALLRVRLRVAGRLGAGSLAGACRGSEGGQLKNLTVTCSPALCYGLVWWPGVALRAPPRLAGRCRWRRRQGFAQ